jgi:hypothetical protein
MRNFPCLLPQLYRMNIAATYVIGERQSKIIEVMLA